MVSIQYLKVDMLHFLFSSGAKRAKLLLRNRPASQNVIALPVLASAGALKSSESVSCFSFICSLLPCAGFHTRRAPLLEATDNDEANRLVTTELALMQHKGVARGGAGNTPPGPRPAIIVSPREHGELTPSQMEHSQDSAPVAVLHAGQPEGGNADLQGGMEDRLRGDQWGGVTYEMVGLASRQETLPLSDRFSELMGGAGVEGYTKKQQEGWQSLGSADEGGRGWGGRASHTGGSTESGLGIQEPPGAPVSTVSVDMGDMDALVDIMYVSNKPFTQVSRCS